jgi:hypothetical protein
VLFEQRAQAIDSGVAHAMDPRGVDPLKLEVPHRRFARREMHVGMTRNAPAKQFFGKRIGGGIVRRPASMWATGNPTACPARAAAYAVRVSPWNENNRRLDLLDELLQPGLEVSARGRQIGERGQRRQFDIAADVESRQRLPDPRCVLPAVDDDRS